MRLRRRGFAGTSASAPSTARLRQELLGTLTARSQKTCLPVVELRAHSTAVVWVTSPDATRFSRIPIWALAATGASKKKSVKRRSSTAPLVKGGHSTGLRLLSGPRKRDQSRFAER